ncbi:MAG TPA: hypothetical protein VIO37_08420 [Candidatus Dormibacteraeota bacterium]|jgi:hypothetical protein
MWRQKGRSAAPRVLAALAALVLSAVAFVYTPIVVTTTSQGSGIRIWLLLALVIVSALSTWMLVVGRENLVVRLAINFSCGFNLIWIFSFIGPPVVVASVLAAGLATVPAPRRLLPVLIGAAVAGLALGLIVLIVTQPPGERIFG